MLGVPPCEGLRWRNARELDSRAWMVMIHWQKGRFLHLYCGILHFIISLCMYARPAIGGLMCMRYIVWIRVPSIMANFHKGITLVDENTRIHLFTRSRTITSKPSLVQKSKIWWGRVNCKFLLVGWRYIGFKKFQAKSLCYFNKIRKLWTLIASSLFGKFGNFFI
jgi:hypothetical protein